MWIYFICSIFSDIQITVKKAYFYYISGSFVVVEEIEREKALDAGSKVTGIICNVLFEEQIRTLKRSSAWSLTLSDVCAILFSS